jgi:peptidoglycan hydrolase-like protein with peptidoglycan-binding domain
VQGNFQVAIAAKPKPSESASMTHKQPFTQTTSVLKLGSQGSAVKQLQNSLKTANVYTGPSNGVFGPETQAAVIKFQRVKGLKADGVVGAKTWAALHG